jgi:long-subunit fatty acid transport protein
MLYSGSGGINRFIWGNAFNIGKNLSIGANISYLFGNMTRESTAMFPDSIHSMNFKVDNYITTGDFYFNFGVQYKQKIKNDLSLVFGAVYAPTTRINATASGNAHTFLIGANGIEYPKDTIATFDAYEGKLVLPWTAGGGIAIQKTDMFVATVDYTYQNWSSFTAFGLSDSLANSNKICAGAEITPNAFNFSSYFSRVRYRLGFYYDRTYLLLRGRQLNEYGITLGFGFPLKGMRTMINIGGQFGSRGTVQGDLIKETYFKFVVGFSIYERWFHKRKYY